MIKVFTLNCVGLIVPAAPSADARDTLLQESARTGHPHFLIRKKKAKSEKAAPPVQGQNHGLLLTRRVG